MTNDLGNPAIITKADAIQSLKPNAELIMRDEVIEWLDKKQTEPTQAEIDAEVIRLQAAYDAKAYARNRAAEYPSIGDQLDMIYHNGDGGATFQAAIKAVKDKYPKP
jgi:hypothetical protein